MKYLVVPVFAFGLIHSCQLIGSTGLGTAPTILIATLWSITLIAICALTVRKLKGF
jgi:hypothetical protein